MAGKLGAGKCPDGNFPEGLFHETILGDLRIPILTLGIPNSLFVHQNRFASQFARLRKREKKLGICLRI